MKKLVVTVIVISLAGIVFFISSQISRSNQDGTLTVVVVDEGGETIIDDILSFNEGESMVEILDSEYFIQCGDGTYQPTDCSNMPSFGRTLLIFEDVETDWWNTFIAIYVNDQYSSSGIDDIEPKEGAIYRFEFTEVGDAQ
jgi:hypothetical protein